MNEPRQLQVKGTARVIAVREIHGAFGYRFHELEFDRRVPAAIKDLVRLKSKEPTHA